MSDLLLLGLIGGLTLLLLMTLLAFAGYSGLLAGVAVSAGSPPVRNITVAYKFHMGPYRETGRLFTESCSVSPKLRSIAIYYDNPHMMWILSSDPVFTVASHNQVSELLQGLSGRGSEAILSPGALGSKTTALFSVLLLKMPHKPKVARVRNMRMGFAAGTVPWYDSRGPARTSCLPSFGSVWGVNGAGAPSRDKRRIQGGSKVPELRVTSRDCLEVPPDKCRCAVGSILSEGEESPSPELIQLYQKFGFKVFSFPAPSHVVTATFPYMTTLSIWLATRRVHPALDAYIKVRARPGVQEDGQRLLACLPDAKVLWVPEHLPGEKELIEKPPLGSSALA
ncbi:hypothetical protein MC885_018619 [Smutsia gigantea]|nr:hypothetical protein MC885_018619 [Smutsia gigantea]